MRWLAAAGCAIAIGCGSGGDDDPAELLFEDITASALPNEMDAIEQDPTDWVCGELCYGSIFGVGAAAADINGDGRVDLYLAGPGGGRLYANTGAPGAIGFELQSTPAGLEDTYVHGAAFGDLDRDGDPDLVVATPTGARILRLVDGSAFEFEDVSARAGARDDLTRTVSITIGDINNDGLLDIHVSEYGSVDARATGRGQLLINRDGFEFEDVAEGILSPRHAWASLMADLDRDGRIDLFILVEKWGHDDQSTLLFYNDGSDGAGRPSLIDRTPAGIEFFSPMGAAVGDPDNDGDLELLVPEVYVFRHLEQSAGDPRELVEVPGIDPCDGEGAECFIAGWGATFQDLDRDGVVEALIVTGAPCLPELCDWQAQPRSQINQLREYAGGEFAPSAASLVARAGGLSGPEGDYQNGRGLVLADFDGDGRDEVLVTPFNDRFRLYRSTLTTGHFLRVELRGTVSAPTPYGAEVTVQTTEGAVWKQLASGGTTHSQHQPALQFELGESTSIDSVEVRWPSGFVQTLEDVAIDQTLVVDEPEQFSLPRRRYEIGTDSTVTAQIQRFDSAGIAVTSDDPTGISVTSSDGVAWTIVSAGAGRFEATRPVPPDPAIVSVEITIDGAVLATTPAVEFR